IFSSTSSTIAFTWRSLDADAMTKQSVITSCPDTSITTASSASLDTAARAATVAILTASSVAVIPGALRASGSSPVPVLCGDRLGSVEPAFGHVLHDAVGHQVPDWPVLLGTLAAVGR